MFFEWFAFQNTPHLDLRSALSGYLVLLALVTLTVAALVRSAADFKRITGRRWFLFVGLLLASPLLAGVLIVGSGPGGTLPAFSVALLGVLPLLAAALWLGPAPAALAGLLAGLTWALFQTGRITQPFEVALLGVVLAAMLRQSYRGVAARGLRQPLIAALAGALVVGWPLAVLGVFAAGQATAMASLERALSALIPALIVNLLGALAAGMIVQAAVMRWPHLHPVHASDLQTAPWERRLIRRIMFTYVPLLVLGILLLVGLVAGTSYRVATRLVVDQMARDAQTAGSQVPFFVQIGRGLIRDLAQDERLASGDSAVREARLVQSLRAVPFSSS